MFTSLPTAHRFHSFSISSTPLLPSFSPNNNMTTASVSIAHKGNNSTTTITPGTTVTVHLDFNGEVTIQYTKPGSEDESDEVTTDQGEEESDQEEEESDQEEEESDQEEEESDQEEEEEANSDVDSDGFEEVSIRRRRMCDNCPRNCVGKTHLCKECSPKCTTKGCIITPKQGAFCYRHYKECTNEGCAQKTGHGTCFPKNRCGNKAYSEEE